MRPLNIIPNHFRVLDFIAWQRDGSLQLNPPFQRRSVWKLGARSYFIDTLVRGLPVPLIFLRERIELDTQHVIREVVDGQQRLRTIFAFVDESLLPGFDDRRDRFTVQPQHNGAIAGKSFRELTRSEQEQIRGYRFSVQILPSEVEDREVLQIFGRLNSTGTRLNPQELRNAEWFGAFKSLMYELAYEQLERWLSWHVFSEDEISRMLEVELVSDLAVNMFQGLSGKTKSMLDRFYKRHDDAFPEGGVLGRRFQLTMDAIDELAGDWIATSAFSRQMHFFTLFAYSYDRLFGLGSPLDRRAARQLPRAMNKCLKEVDRRLREDDVPEDVLRAVSGAATDIGRRRSLFTFMTAICGAKASD